LGRIAVPAFFRAEGFDATTILEMFGRTDVEDVEWIAKAGELVLGVTHKDARIRYRSAERRAVIDAKLRMLCPASGNLTVDEHVKWLSGRIVCAASVVGLYFIEAGEDMKKTVRAGAAPVGPVLGFAGSDLDGVYGPKTHNAMLFWGGAGQGQQCCGHDYLNA
jgi:hypothetical protein